VDAEAEATPLDPGLTGQFARPVPGVDNGYLAGYRVRFDEAAGDGLMRTSALMRYAQDIAWRHSEQLGFDRDWYAERGLGWVVRGVELELHAPVPMGHTLRLTTAVVGHRRIWARRLGECRLADGRLAARVTTDWVLLDGRNRIVRIPADFGVAFQNPELDSEIIRVAAPKEEPAHTLALAVGPRDLDPLAHVNNAVYVDWLDEALETAGWSGTARPEGSTLRLEYLASAERGNQVAVELYGTAADWVARIRRADGQELVRASGAAGAVDTAAAPRAASRG
jgi:acyl-ACP thioesterase